MLCSHSDRSLESCLGIAIDSYGISVESEGFGWAALALLTSSLFLGDCLDISATIASELKLETTRVDEKKTDCFRS